MMRSDWFEKMKQVVNDHLATASRDDTLRMLHDAGYDFYKDVVWPEVILPNPDQFSFIASMRVSTFLTTPAELLAQGQLTKLEPETGTFNFKIAA